MTSSITPCSSHDAWSQVSSQWISQFQKRTFPHRAFDLSLVPFSGEFDAKLRLLGRAFDHQRNVCQQCLGFNGIRIRDLCDTGTMLYQLRRSSLTFIFILSSHMNYFIYFITFHSSRENMNSKLNSLMLVEHRTGMGEVTGSTPVEALNFLRLLYSNCLNWKFTATIISHFIFIRSSHVCMNYSQHS